MGGEDDLNAALAHVVLCCVATRGISRYYGRCYTDPGVHVNCFVHGVLGAINFQSAAFNADVKNIYTVSLQATKYLLLPCFNADLYHYNQAISIVHLLSGVIPFVMAISGQENPHLGKLVIAGNIISLAYFSFEHNLEWGWYTTAAAVFTYFFTPQMNPKVTYPLGLALAEYCSYRVFHLRFVT